VSADSRIEYLLRAAARAEREGNARLAAILKRMAEELRPVDGASTPPILSNS
jgi:hypothetical protein